MPAQFVSCPCCGMTVPPSGLNLDADGNRVREPVVYGAFVKVRGFTEDRRHLIRWTTHPAPPTVLRGVLAQLQAAEAYVQDLLAAT